MANGDFSLWSETAADNDDADSDIDWREGQLPGSVNSSARNMMSALARALRKGPRSTVNLYVRTNGSDSNNGLANTAGGAFLTLQKAVDTASKYYDQGRAGVQINVADGTYTAGFTLFSAIIGTTTISVTGNTTTPANCIIDASGTIIDVQDHAGLSLAGFRITGGSVGIRSRQFSIVDLTNMEWGTLSNTHIAAVDNSVISTLGTHAIVGNAAVHVSATSNSLVNYGGTWTIGSARTFTVFAAVTDCSVITGAATFTGAGVAGTTGQVISSTNGFITRSITWPGSTAAAGTMQADADGTASNPFWTWAQDLNTGDYRIGADNMGTACGGTKVVDYKASGVAIIGSNTNDSAAAGWVGEVISSTVASGSAVGLTNSVAADITSISLTAGDWEIMAKVYFTGNAATTLSFVRGSISSVSATEDGTAGNRGIGFYNGDTVFATTDITVDAGPLRRSVASTTTTYLVALAAFGVSTCSAYGYIQARRLR